MRDPNRIKLLLEKLEKVWMKSPDLRFGQLLENLISDRDHNSCCIFYLEDEMLENELDKEFAKNSLLFQ